MHMAHSSGYHSSCPNCLFEHNGTPSVNTGHLTKLCQLFLQMWKMLEFLTSPVQYVPISHTPPLSTYTATCTNTEVSPLEATALDSTNGSLALPPGM